MRRKRGGAVVAFLAGLVLGLVGFSKRTCPGTRASFQPDPLAVVHLPQTPSPRRLLLFVGIMTAAEYLPTRAIAVWKTWARQVPGRVAFFSSEGSVAPPGLPLVPLPGVDDSYPPQKKSLAMLAYMARHYGERFEWFMRADDDVLVRPDRLAALLRAVDGRRPVFLGQAGRGSAAEAGTLALADDENFCMGGPGVILSRETLSRVAPHLKTCLQNLMTNHEDVELGRCVRKYAGVSCTWSYEMQTILYHNGSGDAAYRGSLKTKEIHRAITLHPIKDFTNMYRLHRYMNKLRVRDLLSDGVGLHRDLLAMSQLLKLTPVDTAHAASPYAPEFLGDTSLLGRAPGLTKHVSTSLDDLIPWDYLQRSIYSASDSNPRRRLDTPLREGLDDVIAQAMEKINKFSKQRGRVIDFKEVLYGYTRYNPLYGADYIIDMLLIYRKYRGKKMTLPVRRHSYFQIQFTGLEIREVHEGNDVSNKVEEQEEDTDFSEDTSYKSVEPEALNDNFGGLKETLENGLIKIKENLPMLLFSRNSILENDVAIKNKVINFIVPLSGRVAVFRRFTRVFESVCLSRGEKVTLKVILFPDDNSSLEKIIAILKDIQRKYRWVNISAIPVFESFSRGKALAVGASSASPEDLLLFIDVDMVFDANALHRVRTHTLLGKQAYFPIVYSEYDPRVAQNVSESRNHFKIDDYTGFWRQYGFGIAAMYKSDLEKVGGYNTTIKGWGKEDVDLFDKFISNQNEINVFRAPEPGMVHAWHEVACFDSIGGPDRALMCRATRADTIASRQRLAEMYLSI